MQKPISPTQCSLEQLPSNSTVKTNKMGIPYFYVVGINSRGYTMYNHGLGFFGK